MGWYLVLYLVSTSDVLVKPFENKAACESYRRDHQAEFKKDKDIKASVCAEGAPIDGLDNRSYDASI
jgi:hypothetical protein